MKIRMDVKSNGLICELAKWCAKTVYHARVRMHLLALYKAGLADHECYNQQVVGEDFRDAQSLIRSIKDRDDRRVFVRMVKGYFSAMWEGQHARTRDYVESVRKHQQQEAA
jgi:hypothetical protein